MGNNKLNKITDNHISIINDAFTFDVLPNILNIKCLYDYIDARVALLK